MSAGDGQMRLPRAPQGRRANQVGLHLNDDEHRLITEAAAQHGLKAGAWLTQLGLAAATKLTVPDDAEYRVLWADSQITYHTPESAMLASVDGQLDDLEPGESITITRIRKG